MSDKVQRFFAGAIAVVIILGVVGGIGGNVAAKRSFPQIDGNVQLAGLDGPVDVYRDAMGIPHIYATTTHDLFMVQGYVHAQDRFWQMDFSRHTGMGRISEMFGDGQVETDMFLRTLGWYEIAQQEYNSASPESKLIMDSYSDGVNAYLENHDGTELSLEYGILALRTPGYTPEPWTSVHSLVWAKAMAWDLKGNINQEIERAVLLKTLPAEYVDELFPGFPEDHPVIVPEIGDFTADLSASAFTVTNSDADIAAQLPIDTLTAAQQQLSMLESVLGPSGQDIGSNNWVVSGGLTASGKPLLANDPHLGIQMPAIWYSVGLHCEPISDACPFNVVGYSFAGVPGVVVGHNDYIAWGVTNTGPDVIDLFIEKINPENPNQYEYMGEWVDMEVRTDTILVGGGDSIELTVRSTVHGPIISDTYEPVKPRAVVEDSEDEFPLDQRTGGIEFPENYAIAMRWTALEPTKIFRAVWSFNKATNWDEFREAARDWAVPAQNLVYADIYGNIGYQMPGNVPMRKNGDGRLPVPGWTGEYDWMGYIPFEELPFVFNPPIGYVATANNQVEPWDYPFIISTDYDLGYRADRIVEMIENAPGLITPAYIQQMHGDSFDASAAFLVPALLKVDLGDSALEARRALFNGWDYQMRIDSAPGALYASFWSHFLANTFADELPFDRPPGGSSRWFEVARRMVGDESSHWWDDQSTPDVVETRTDIFKKSFAEAVDELEERLGKDASKWKWGDLHIATFENQTLGKSGVAPIESLFNRGGFSTSGGASLVNATGWATSLGYEVTSVPSFRMIVDFSDFNQSLGIHTTGQSGHAYHQHYIDMAPIWANVGYAPLWWAKTSIVADAEGHLRFTP